uniref:zinc finger CCHC domain-containing protein 14-like isoform X2 n=1 Tax=Myxine glutinosa TaxID=7769 RepID=UPI00358F16B3
MLYKDLKKDDVYRWLGELSPAPRLEFLCGLLDLCNPLELRFLASCLEELARKDYHSLRDAETKGNSSADLAKLTNLTDEVVRSKLIVSVALLYSDNREAASMLFGILAYIDTIMHNYGLQLLGRTGDEFLLLYTMASNHPAFTFHQKQALRSDLREIANLAGEEDAPSDGDSDTSDGKCSPQHEASLRASDGVCKGVSEGPLSQSEPFTCSLCTRSSYLPVSIERIERKWVKKKSDRQVEYLLEVMWSNGFKNSLTKTQPELLEFFAKLPQTFCENGLDNVGLLPSSVSRNAMITQIIAPHERKPSQSAIGCDGLSMRCISRRDHVSSRWCGQPASWSTKEEQIEMAKTVSPGHSILPKEEVAEKAGEMQSPTLTVNKSCDMDAILKCLKSLPPHVLATAHVKDFLWDSQNLQITSCEQHMTSIPGRADCLMEESVIRAHSRTENSVQSCVIPPKGTSANLQAWSTGLTLTTLAPTLPPSSTGPVTSDSPGAAGHEPSAVLEWLKKLRLHKYYPEFWKLSMDQFLNLSDEDVDRFENLTEGAKKKLKTQLAKEHAEKLYSSEPPACTITNSVFPMPSTLFQSPAHIGQSSQSRPRGSDSPCAQLQDSRESSLESKDDISNLRDTAMAGRHPPDVQGLEKPAVFIAHHNPAICTIRPTAQVVPMQTSMRKGHPCFSSGSSATCIPLHRHKDIGTSTLSTSDTDSVNRMSSAIDGRPQLQDYNASSRRFVTCAPTHSASSGLPSILVGQGFAVRGPRAPIAAFSSASSQDNNDAMRLLSQHPLNVNQIGSLHSQSPVDAAAPSYGIKETPRSNSQPECQKQTLTFGSEADGIGTKPTLIPQELPAPGAPAGIPAACTTGRGGFAIPRQVAQAGTSAIFSYGGPSLRNGGCDIENAAMNSPASSIATCGPPTQATCRPAGCSECMSCGCDAGCGDSNGKSGPCRSQTLGYQYLQPFPTPFIGFPILSLGSTVFFQQQQQQQQQQPQQQPHSVPSTVAVSTPAAAFYFPAPVTSPFAGGLSNDHGLSSTVTSPQQYPRNAAEAYYHVPLQQSYPVQAATPAVHYQYTLPTRASTTGVLRRGTLQGLSCYNCGSSGHRASDCKQPTMDCSQSTFRLKYAPPMEAAEPAE